MVKFGTILKELFIKTRLIVINERRVTPMKTLKASRVPVCLTIPR